MFQGHTAQSKRVPAHSKHADSFLSNLVFDTSLAQICGDSFPPRQREAAPVVMVPFSIADKKPMTWDRSELAIRIPGGGKRKVALPMLRNGDESPTITTPVRKLFF
jgi:hypothetical protein